jgi:hypothetical protein
VLAYEGAVNDTAGSIIYVVEELGSVIALPAKK